MRTAACAFFIVTIALLVLGQHVYGQLVEKNVVFFEHFDNNERGWFLANDAHVEWKIQGGTLLAKGYFEETKSAFVKHLIPAGRDFEISIRFKLEYLATKGSVGIAWGNLEQGMMYLDIGAEGLVRAKYLGVSEEDNKVYQSQSRQSPHKNGGWQTLRIFADSSTARAFLNDSLVLTFEPSKQKVTYVGVTTFDYTTCSFDSLQIWHHAPILEYKESLVQSRKVFLDSSINTAYEQLAPLISPDGKTLYWVVLRDPNNIGGFNDMGDIWYSKRDSTGLWGTRRNIGEPLNNKNPNWVISITPDNQSKILANQYQADSIEDRAGISRSFRQKNQWSLPTRIVIDSFKNESDFVQYNLTQDQQTLVIAAALAMDSALSQDIYVAFAKPDGGFGRPMNVGPVVNSIGDEYSPFLASDGETLYFSSDGHGGYGQQDIFMTKRLDSTWSNWSRPVNLGSAINGAGDDKHLTLAASADSVYYSSTNPETGQSQIVHATLPEVLQPNPVVIVLGRVLDARSQAPVEAKVEYFDLKSNKRIGVAKSSPEDGSYKIVLPSKRRYAFLAEKAGFYATSQNVDLTNLTSYQEQKQDLLLSPIEQGSRIVLNNVFFDTGLWSLRSESTAELDRLADLLNKQQAIHILVEGHTDNVGTEPDNQILSERRALSVVEYLRGKGVPASHIQWKGWGAKRPLIRSNDPASRQMNRRVEFEILTR